MMFVGAAALLFFCVLVLHSLWQTGRKYPAAVHARPNGIKGGLFLVVAFLFGVAVVDGGSAANILLFISERTPGGLPADVILRYGTPGIAGSVLCLAAIHRLIVGRDKKALIYTRRFSCGLRGPLTKCSPFGRRGATAPKRMCCLWPRSVAALRFQRCIFSFPSVPKTPMVYSENRCTFLGFSPIVAVKTTA